MLGEDISSDEIIYTLRHFYNQNLSNRAVADIIIRICAWLLDTSDHNAKYIIASQIN